MCLVVHDFANPSVPDQLCAHHAQPAGAEAARERGRRVERRGASRAFFEQTRRFVVEARCSPSLVPQRGNGINRGDASCRHERREQRNHR
jgi:hypothetical protein